MSFGELQYLHLLWAALVLGLVYAVGFNWKRRAMTRFATSNLLGDLVPTFSPGRQRLKAVLVVLALALLAFALTWPQWGEAYEDIRVKGIDIMLCLDVSRSMLAEDLIPNRLERAKEDIRELLRILPGDRVGLLAFAGKAELECPLTVDYGFFRMVLDEIDPRTVPIGGSLIGDAIRTAADAFDDKEKNHKAIIVITDGEDHESYPAEAAREAFRQRGIRVFTIGLGNATQGKRVPIEKDGKKVFLQHEGQELWSKMNPALLKEIAVEGGGAYVPAGTANIDIEGIYREHIATLDRKEFEEREVIRRVPRYQWFAGLAFLLLCFEVVVSERRAGPARRNVRSTVA